MTKLNGAAMSESNSNSGRSILLAPYSLDSEKMALAFFACERARWDAFTGERRIVWMTHVPVHEWRADWCRFVEPVPNSEGGLRWLNKLEALVRCASQETIFFDCDMVVLGDISGWFEQLGTDDFTFFTRYLRPEEVRPEQMLHNVLNPRAFCEHYGVERMPAIAGGGHYFFRNTERGRSVLRRIAEIMIEAASNPNALYWKLAGEGNLIGDEPAASMAVVELGIQLPPPTTVASSPAVAMFMEGPQRWIQHDLASGNVRFFCSWAKQEITPTVVHFGGHGKTDSVYSEHVERVWAARSRHAPECPAPESPRAEPPPPPLSTSAHVVHRGHAALRNVRARPHTLLRRRR